MTDLTGGGRQGGTVVVGRVRERSGCREEGDGVGVEGGGAHYGDHRGMTENMMKIDK
jgi:hypothetical protein